MHLLLERQYPCRPMKELGPIVHEYFDHAEGCYLCVQERSNHFSLARIFGDLVTYWRFTLDGRIRDISFTIREDSVKRFHPVVEVSEINRATAWDKGIAKVCPLPDIFNNFDAETMSHHPEDQYRIFISRGIKNVLRILASLDKPSIDVVRRDGQQSFQVLRENKQLYAALEYIVAHEPDVSLDYPTPLHIQYD